MVYMPPWKEDTREQWPETLYSFRPNRTGELVIAKWCGGREPTTTYEISSMGKGRCNCIGSTRKPYCKHRRIVDTVEAICMQAGFPIWGCYWDDTHQLLYTPADGEGVSYKVPNWDERLAQLTADSSQPQQPKQPYQLS